MSNQQNNAPGDQFVLSYELLKLMRRIVEHHDEEFKQFISMVVAKQLLESRDSAEAINQEDAQYAITDFLGLIEVLLMEIRNEQAINTVLQRQLMPAVDHIDTSSCDQQTIATSIMDATQKFEKNPRKNPQELLYKELLRNWKPAKKVVQN